MKIRVRISTRISGSTVSEDVEIPDEELQGLDDMARGELIQEYVEMTMANLLDVTWQEVQ